MAEDGRIRAERFRQRMVEREVDYSPLYQDLTGLVGSNQEVARNLIQIVRRLGAGDLIPEKFYRNGIDRDRDELLEQHGIKHLHLHEDTEIDALLFLVEYGDFVLLLCVDGHRRHFNKPVGSVLRSLHDSAIRHADAKAERLKAAKVAAVKEGLRPRSSAAKDAE